MKKTVKPGGRLPLPAVAFAKKLIGAGVPSEFFVSLTYDSPTCERQFAFALAALSRLQSQEIIGPPGYNFKPVALGWHLGEAKAGYHSLLSRNQYNVDIQVPGNAVFSTQLQPELAPTIVTVVELCRTDFGLRLLQEICLFGFDKSETSATEYLLRNHIGLGLAHAESVAEEFVVRPLPFANEVVPVFGPGSSGRSLFVLIEYQAYSDRNDKVGVTRIGWLEHRILTAEVTDHRALVSLHSKLDHPIPEGSLMAIGGNIKWFKEPRPAGC